MLRTRLIFYNLTPSTTWGNDNIVIICPHLQFHVYKRPQNIKWWFQQNLIKYLLRNTCINVTIIPLTWLTNISNRRPHHVLCQLGITDANRVSKVIYIKAYLIDKPVWREEGLSLRISWETCCHWMCTCNHLIVLKTKWCIHTVMKLLCV